MAKHAVLKFVALHKHMAADGQRAGQRFVNLFIKYPWDTLFYEKDEEKALWLIRDWLDRHQYTEALPKCEFPEQVPQQAKHLITN